MFMNQNMAAAFAEVFARWRAWFDDEPYLPAKLKEKSRSDLFVEAVCGELEAVIVREKFASGLDRVYLPAGFQVEISRADGDDFAGRKRELLRAALNEFAKSVYRLLGVAPSSETPVELSIASDLNAGEFRLGHRWDDTYRPSVVVWSADTSGGAGERSLYIPGEQPTNFAGDQSDDSETVISGRALRCRLSLRRLGTRVADVPVFKREITIGRGVASSLVDVGLDDDLEISRRHATISWLGQDLFTLLMLGQNPAHVSGRPVFRGESVTITWETEIRMASYALELLPFAG